MIGKKVPNPDKSAAKSVRIMALARYMHTPETERATEKCLYWGARGFLTDALDTQAAEMIALAEDARRSVDPIAHYVLSWREGEHPSNAQVEEAMDLLVDEMEVRRHQMMYALHGDTDNVHVHIMLNRTDPDTGKVVKINRGFDRRALYRVCARIEHAQGWQRERNAPFRVNAAGEVEDVGRSAAQGASRPTQRQVDTEHRRGEASAARLAIERAGPLIEATRSWRELHASLAERGMRYARTGSGAVIAVGSVYVKASTVSRQASLARLQARFGPYEGAELAARPRVETTTAPGRTPTGAPRAGAADPMKAPALIEAARSWRELHHALAAQGLRYERKGSGARIVAGATHEERSMKASAVSRGVALRRLEARFGPYEAASEQGTESVEKSIVDMPLCDTYLAARAQHHAAQHAAWLACEAEREEEERALAKRQRKEREAMFRQREWHGRLRELQALRALYAAEHAQEKARLRAQRRDREKALRARQFPFPEYAQWVDHPALAALWRERAEQHPALESASPRADTAAPGKAYDIRDYEARTVGHWVLYATAAQHARGDVAFVDRGKRITLHDRDDPEAASLAAMQLAAAKWGRFRVRGSQEHKRRSARLAAEHGFELVNPELQDLIETHRREIDQRREEPRYGSEAAGLAREIRRIGEAHGTVRLVFDPPPGAGDAKAPRRITAVDGAGARHALGQHDVDTVARAKACVKGQAPRPSLTARLEARRARLARAAVAQATPSPAPQPSTAHRSSGRGIGD